MDKFLIQIAKKENISVDFLKKGIKNGTIVIFNNPLHKNVVPIAVGAGLSTKVNANIGTSQDYPKLSNELKKLEICIEAKSDTVMDLSTGGDIDKIRRKIIKNSPLPVGTVPIYQAVAEAKGLKNLEPDLLFDTIEKHASDGVDFVTIHSGVNLKIVELLKKKKRLMGIVSRGGSMIYSWMRQTGKENPLFEQFDRLLKILKRYNVALSLGDGLRPGSIFDAGDDAQITELKTLAKLAKIARKNGVQVIIEGPGHVPLNQIESQMKMQKKLCDGAPFYVLGPLPTDIGAGHDHIVCAIGGALAASFGADFLCYVTPSEHLGLPSKEDVREGIIATKIAAHIADIAKGVPSASERDLEMSKARKMLNWGKQLSLALDPVKAIYYHKKLSSQRKKECTMCGDYCAMKIFSEK